MNIFFASDHHLGHANILTFKRSDGSTPLRDFPDVEFMNQYIVHKHNSVVKPSDKVYFLGDVAFSHKNLHYLSQMNGEKVLIKGNHDKCKLSQYAPYFKDVRGVHQVDGMILSHIPLHAASVARWGINVHGHTHDRWVMLDSKNIDTRYFNTSLEALKDYTPISLEQVKSRIRGWNGVCA